MAQVQAPLTDAVGSVNEAVTLSLEMIARSKALLQATSLAPRASKVAVGNTRTEASLKLQDRRSARA